MSFLVTSAHIFYKEKGSVCNFLIHPSVRIVDHEAIAGKIGEYLNLLLSTLSKKKQLASLLKEAWIDLQSSKPDLAPLDDVVAFVHGILDDQKINIFVMNSLSSQALDFSAGINIIIGGNSLGRGVTFPVLQTVYYCRKSKSPQADTFWQHCRMFGYDRDPGLMRIFIPPSLLKLFTELSVANSTLFEQIDQHGIDDISLIYSKSVKPTRKNILDQDFMNLTVGGVNYFPRLPVRKSFNAIEKYLSDFSHVKQYHEIDYQIALELIQFFESESKKDWDKTSMLNCLKGLISRKSKAPVYLIVRRNRDIGKNTGTLLSPDDRALGAAHANATIITLYRVNGEKKKGWDGNPIWIPNVKFPVGFCFYRSDG